MGSYTAINGGLSNAASTAYSFATGLERSIHGDTRKCHFVQGTKTIIEFDAVVTDDHTQGATPTVFPLERGQTIADHIIVEPFELTLTGVISDSPIGNQQTIITEAVTSAVNFAAGPLGVLIAGADNPNSTLRAQRGTTSPSAAAFATLTRLTAGDPENGITPQPFDVVTSLKSYQNMVIRNLSVGRDTNSGRSLLFQMSLVKMLLVSPQQTNIQLFKNKALASHKAKLGEKESEAESQLNKAFRKGVNDRDALSGIPPSYPTGAAE